MSLDLQLTEDALMAMTRLDSAPMAVAAFKMYTPHTTLSYPAAPYSLYCSLVHPVLPYPHNCLTYSPTPRYSLITQCVLILVLVPLIVLAMCVFHRYQKWCDPTEGGLLTQPLPSLQGSGTGSTGTRASSFAVVFANACFASSLALSGDFPLCLSVCLSLI